MLGLSLALPHEALLTDIAQISAIAAAMYDYRESIAYQTALGTTPSGTGDPVGFLQDLSGNAPAVMGTVGSRPLMQAGGITFDGTDDRLNGFNRSTIMASSRYTVPDVSDSDTGKGYTCTGTTIDTSDDTLWDCNDGRSNSADVTHRGSVINKTRVGGFIREIDLAALYPSSTSFQGVQFDPDTDGGNLPTGSLWVASKGENLMRRISKVDGSTISSFASTEPNGVGIDTVTGYVIVTRDSGDVAVYTRAGVQVGSTFNLGESFDQIDYDSATGLLYYTRGSATDGNYIGVFHLPSRQFVTRLMTPEADQIEGIAVDGTTVYVNNDGYFHDGAADLNETLVYELDSAPVYTPQTKVTLFAKFNCAAPSGTRAVVSANSGVSNAGAGIWPIGSSSTSVRVFVNSNAGTTERDSVDFTGLPDMTISRAIVLEIDTVAKTLDLEVDGVAYGGTKSLTNVAGGISTGQIVLSAAKDNTNELASTIQVGGAFNRFLTAPEKVALNRYLAAA